MALENKSRIDFAGWDLPLGLRNDAQRWIISALSASCDNTQAQADRLRLKERETIAHFFDGYVVHVIV